MKAKFKRISQGAVWVIVVLLAVLSCTKTPDTIGLDLLDDNQPFVGKDTSFNIIAYSTIEDSVTTDETSVNLLGSMYTSTFGRSNTSIFTQVRISSLYPDWGTNPVADSVVFSLVYDGFYGNIETEQTVRAYRILEDLSWDSTYYSNVNFETSTEEMAVHSFYPDLTEIPVIDSGGGTSDTSYIEAELRIPFDLAFADYMFNLDTSHTSSSDAFLEEFKGIHLRNDHATAAGDGAILYFNLLDSRSVLTIYYQNEEEDSLEFKFFINLNNARVGRYEHEYELSTDQNFLAQVINGDTTKGEEFLYLQGTGGVKTHIWYPGVVEWLEQKGRVINEAKLYVNLAEEYDPETHPTSTSLIVFKNTAEGGFNFIPDQLQGEAYFNGKYNAESNNYFFRTSLHLQDLLLGEPDYGLGMFPNAKSVKATQMKIHGYDPTLPNSFHLQVIYTDIE